MGEYQTAPKWIQVKEPQADQVYKRKVELHWNDVEPYVAIFYQIHDATGRVLEDQYVKLEGADFTAFVDAIGATIKSRSEAAIWADIQAKYTLVDK